MHSPNFIAGGDISPSTIVQKTGNNHEVTAATAFGNHLIGIAQEGSRRVPRNDGSSDDLLAAKSGESLHVYGEGEECLVKYGDTVNAGDYLTANGTSLAIPVDLTSDTFHGVVNYVAVALEDGLVNELHRVVVKIGIMKAPLNAYA